MWLKIEDLKSTGRYEVTKEGTKDENWELTKISEQTVPPSYINLDHIVTINLVKRRVFFYFNQNEFCSYLCKSEHAARWLITELSNLMFENKSVASFHLRYEDDFIITRYD